jgi:hypothetical protein
MPRVLLVLDRADRATWLSFRNLGGRLQIVIPEELNAHDIVLSDVVVFSKNTLEQTVKTFGATAEPKTTKAATTAAKPPAEGAAADGVPPAAASDAREQEQE